MKLDTSTSCVVTQAELVSLGRVEQLVSAGQHPLPVLVFFASILVLLLKLVSGR